MLFDVVIDCSEVTRAWAAEVRNMQQGVAECVDASGREGKAVARVLAPHRSYELRNSIDANVDKRGPEGSEGHLEATAQQASWMKDGTRPHPIMPKRKKFLRFQGPGGVVFAKRVNHPGTKPHDFWDRAVAAAEVTLVRSAYPVMS